MAIVFKMFYVSLKNLCQTVNWLSAPTVPLTISGIDTVVQKALNNVISSAYVKIYTCI